jgi:hypothetical protein
MISSAPKELTAHLTDLDGVAQFVEGGDIFDPQEPNEVFKASSHHKGFGKAANKDGDPVLHRLVLASHGRKLYEFSTFSELMRGAKEMNSGTTSIYAQLFLADTFPGLRALYERRIIHGEISLGNLFLGMQNEIAGFIGDLDLAKVDLKIIKELFPEWYDVVASSKRGALRTVSLVLGHPVTADWPREPHYL